MSFVAARVALRKNPQSGRSLLQPDFDTASEFAWQINPVSVAQSKRDEMGAQSDGMLRACDKAGKTILHPGSIGSAE